MVSKTFHRKVGNNPVQSLTCVPRRNEPRKSPKPPRLSGSTGRNASDPRNALGKLSGPPENIACRCRSPPIVSTGLPFLSSYHKQAKNCQRQTTNHHATRNPCLPKSNLSEPQVPEAELTTSCTTNPAAADSQDGQARRSATPWSED